MPPGNNVAEWALDVLQGVVPRNNQVGLAMDDARKPDDFKEEFLEEMQHPKHDCFDEDTEEGKGFIAQAVQDMLEFTNTKLGASSR